MADRIVVGSARISDTELENLKISGSCTIENDIKADEIKVVGYALFEGNCEAEEIKIAGSAKFNRNVKCEEINIAGSTDVLGNIETEKCQISGMTHITGDINADSIEIASVHSTFSNIYGDELKCVESADYNKNNRNTANEIEVTKLSIRNFKANRISADKIKIGLNCEIDVVEFRESLEISKDAKIKRIIKL